MQVPFEWFDFFRQPGGDKEKVQDQPETANLSRYLSNVKKSGHVSFILLYCNSKCHVNIQGLDKLVFRRHWEVPLKGFSYIFRYRFVLITIILIYLSLFCYKVKINKCWLKKWDFPIKISICHISRINIMDT